MKRIINQIIKPLGVKVVRLQSGELVYHHRYEGGYDQYRSIQIKHNKRKIENVWADDRTLSVIADDIRRENIGSNGVCHGARNGFEVKWFRENLSGDVIGTDISETATQFEHMVVWDFHEVNPEWVGKFDFVYTNSLDQAMDPQKAISAWVGQLSHRGRVYIEHTMAHAPQGAGEMDPFGAHPMTMPYLFFKWGRGQYKLVDILEVQEKQNNRMHAWIFVLSRD
jgi:hypothetical protein